MFLNIKMLLDVLGFDVLLNEKAWLLICRRLICCVNDFLDCIKYGVIYFLNQCFNGSLHF